MLRFLLLSVAFWLVIYVVCIVPDHEKLASLENRSNELLSEINKIDHNFAYLKAEREDLLNNDRFYIQKLSREKLHLVIPSND